MKRIRSQDDEQPMLFTRWTQRNSQLRDKILTTVIREVLMPEQVTELERMRRFSIGDKVRVATVEYLRKNWWMIRDKFVTDNGGSPGSWDVDKYLARRDKRPIAEAAR